MKTKMLKFAMWLTGHDMKTIEKLYKDFSGSYKPGEIEFIKPTNIEDIICEYYKATKYRIYQRSRKIPYIYYRQLIQYFMKRLTRLDDTRIGKRTGGFDRTTVINNSKVILNYIETDSKKRDEINEIEQKIEG